MSTETENNVKIPTKMVYCGRRIGGKGALVNKWIEIKDGKADDLRSRLYADFRPNFCGIGTTFTVDIDDKNSVYSGTTRDPGKYEEEKDVARWEAEDRAAWNKHQEAKLVKRLAKNSAFADAVAPIKRIYSKMPFSDKDAFILMLINELKRRSK